MTKVIEEITERQAGRVFRFRGQPADSIKNSGNTATRDALKVLEPAAEKCRAHPLLKCRWHDVRHTVATRVARHGVDIETVRRLMGHSDINMTARYYHSDEKATQRAVDVLVLREVIA